MTISSEIRALAQQGLTTSEIARKLGITYQHAYKVLKDGGREISGGNGQHSQSLAQLRIRPPLFVRTLLDAGFTAAGRWTLSEVGQIVCDGALPAVAGVYAFAKDDIVLYVGVATNGLAKRLYFYGRPGVSQKTNIRLNGLIRAEIESGSTVHVYIASPPDFTWGGLPIHGAAGLELGIIRAYGLPWNIRSGQITGDSDIGQQPDP